MLVKINFFDQIFLLFVLEIAAANIEWFCYFFQECKQSSTLSWFGDMGV